MTNKKTKKIETLDPRIREDDRNQKIFTYYFLLMFPLFHIGPYIEVHMFGLSLVIAWAVFFWLLHKYSTEQGISKNIFQNIALYTGSIFFWSRIVYIMTDWRNEKYLFIDLVE